MFSIKIQIFLKNGIHLSTDRTKQRPEKWVIHKTIWSLSDSYKEIYFTFTTMDFIENFLQLNRLEVHEVYELHEKQEKQR